MDQASPIYCSCCLAEWHDRRDECSQARPCRHFEASHWRRRWRHDCGKGEKSTSSSLIFNDGFRRHVWFDRTDGQHSCTLRPKDPSPPWNSFWQQALTRTPRIRFFLRANFWACSSNDFCETFFELLAFYRLYYLAEWHDLDNDRCDARSYRHCKASYWSWSGHWCEGQGEKTHFFSQFMFCECTNSWVQMLLSPLFFFLGRIAGLRSCLLQKTGWITCIWCLNTFSHQLSNRCTFF